MRSILAAAFAAFLCAVAVFVVDAPVAAHGGGLDGYGCHNDRKAGTYHCHRGPCAGQTFSSQAEMLRAACSKG